MQTSNRLMNPVSRVPYIKTLGTHDLVVVLFVKRYFAPRRLLTIFGKVAALIRGWRLFE